MRAEDECRQRAGAVSQQQVRARRREQRLRKIQEVLADGEYGSGQFYENKGKLLCGRQPAADAGGPVPDLQQGGRSAVGRRPNPGAGWGTVLRSRRSPSYTRLVRDYPLSVHVDAAKARLQGHERARPAGRSGGHGAHEVRTGEPHQARACCSKVWGGFSMHPDMTHGGQIRAARRCRGCVPRIPAKRSAGGRRHTGDERRRHRIGSGRRLALWTPMPGRARGSAGAASADGGRAAAKRERRPPRDKGPPATPQPRRPRRSSRSDAKNQKKAKTPKPPKPPKKAKAAKQQPAARSRLQTPAATPAPGGDAPPKQ